MIQYAIIQRPNYIRGDILNNQREEMRYENEKRDRRLLILRDQMRDEKDNTITHALERLPIQTRRWVIGSYLATIGAVCTVVLAPKSTSWTKTLIGAFVAGISGLAVGHIIP